MLRQPIEPTCREAASPPDVLPPDEDWTADLAETADLDGMSTTDGPSPIADGTHLGSVNGASPRGRAPASADQKPDAPRNRANTADFIQARELPRAPMPERRAIGFFLFVACALMGALLLTQRPTESARADTKMKAEPPPLPIKRLAANLNSESKPVQPPPAPSAAATRKSAGASVSLGTVTFGSRSFATSEKAVAAVFIVRRTKNVRGRAAVRWAARSGSADAGIDFSDASGTVRFADGQRERAIYVPLRNDLLKEDDETFKVCLRSVGQARIGGAPCAEATIRDDDSIPST